MLDRRGMSDSSIVHEITLDEDGFRPLVAVTDRSIDDELEMIEQVEEARGTSSKKDKNALYRCAILNSVRQALQTNQKPLIHTGDESATREALKRFEVNLTHPLHVYTMQDLYLASPTGEVQIRMATALVSGSVHRRRVHEEIRAAFSKEPTLLQHTVDGRYEESDLYVFSTGHAIVLERTCTIRKGMGEESFSTDGRHAHHGMCKGHFGKSGNTISVTECQQTSKLAANLEKGERLVILFAENSNEAEEAMNNEGQNRDQGAQNLSWQTVAPSSLRNKRDLCEKFNFAENVVVGRNFVEVTRLLNVPLDAQWIFKECGVKYTHRRVYTEADAFEEYAGNSRVLTMLDCTTSCWNASTRKEELMEGALKRSKSNDTSVVTLSSDSRSGSSSRSSASRSTNTSSSVSSNRERSPPQPKKQKREVRRKQPRHHKPKWSPNDSTFEAPAPRRRKLGERRRKRVSFSEDLIFPEQHRILSKDGSWNGDTPFPPRETHSKTIIAKVDSPKTPSFERNQSCPKDLKFICVTVDKRPTKGPPLAEVTLGALPYECDSPSIRSKAPRSGNGTATGSGEKYETAPESAISMADRYRGRSTPQFASPCPQPSQTLTPTLTMSPGSIRRGQPKVLSFSSSGTSDRPEFSTIKQPSSSSDVINCSSFMGTPPRHSTPNSKTKAPNFESALRRVEEQMPKSPATSEQGVQDAKTSPMIEPRPAEQRPSNTRSQYFPMIYQKSTEAHPKSTDAMDKGNISVQPKFPGAVHATGNNARNVIVPHGSQIVAPKQPDGKEVQKCFTTRVAINGEEFEMVAVYSIFHPKGEPFNFVPLSFKVDDQVLWDSGKRAQSETRTAVLNTSRSRGESEVRTALSNTSRSEESARTAIETSMVSVSPIGHHARTVTNYGPAPTLPQAFVRRASDSQAPSMLEMPVSLKRRIGIATPLEVQNPGDKPVLVRVTGLTGIEIDPNETILQSNERFNFILNFHADSSPEGELLVEWVAVQKGHRPNESSPSHTAVHWIQEADGIVARKVVAYSSK